MLHTNLFPLAVKPQDLLEYIVPAIVMIMWAASQLMGGKPKQPPPKPRARPVPPAHPVAPPGPAGQQPTLEETLRREVEEFMRRAQGRPPAKQPLTRAPAAPGRPSPQRVENRPTVKPLSKAAPAERTRRLTDAPGAQTTAQSPGQNRPAPTGAAVSQHVAQHLSGATAITAHAQHLGAEVALADERMQEHLKEKFTHQLGRLDHQVTDGAGSKRQVARSPMAQQLVTLLSQPGGVRQVVIASEVLRRPEERWTTRRTGES